MFKSLHMWVLCLLILVTACKGPGTRHHTREKLRSWDQSLARDFLYYDAFSQITPRSLDQAMLLQDSLESLNTRKMHRNELALYHLLCVGVAVVRNQDSLVLARKPDIDEALDLFSQHNECDHLTRALLFAGIARFIKNNRDHSDLHFFERSMETYEASAHSDPYLLAAIHFYKGKSHRRYRETDQALRSFEKADSIMRAINDSVGSILVKRDMASMLLFGRENDKAFDLLNTIRHLDQYPRDVQEMVYRMYHFYYGNIGDYSQMIALMNKRHDLYSGDLDSLEMAEHYFRLSRSYGLMNEPDSVLHFAFLSMDFSPSDTNKRLHVLYDYIAQVYEDYGEYEKASAYYARTYIQFRDIISRNRILENRENRNRELIREYELSLQRELEQQQRSRQIMWFAIVASFLITILVVLLSLYYRMFINKKRAEENLRHFHLTQGLLKMNTGLIPELTVKLSHIANQSIKISPRLFESINDALNEFKNNFRINLTEIVTSDSFISQNAVVKNLTCLSNQEKIIMSFYEKYNTAEIAELLGTTQGSVRASKSRVAVF